MLFQQQQADEDAAKASLKKEREALLIRLRKVLHIYSMTYVCVYMYICIFTYLYLNVHRYMYICKEAAKASLKKE